MTTLAADPVVDPVEAAIARVLSDNCTTKARPACPITEDYLLELQARHEGIWCESTAEGEIIISGASDPPTSAGEGELFGQVRDAASTRPPGTTRPMTGGFNIEGWGFKLPDVSWISREREQAALQSGRVIRGYLPVAPEFAIEVRSPSDSLVVLREKMVGWTTHGVLLGLLVDPQRRNVHIYRDGREQRILHDPDAVSCEPEMPGLVLDFAAVWPLFGD